MVRSDASSLVTAGPWCPAHAMGSWPTLPEIVVVLGREGFRRPSQPSLVPIVHLGWRETPLRTYCKPSSQLVLTGAQHTPAGIRPRLMGTLHRTSLGLARLPR